MARPARLVLLAAALAACGGEPSLDDYTKTQRAAVERNLAAFSRIADELRTRPPLVDEGLGQVEAVVVDPFGASADQAAATLAYAEDLANPNELGYVWGRIEGTGALNHCASMLNHGHAAYDPAHPEQSLMAVDLTEAQLRYPRCAGFRFLFALRTLEFLRPSTPVAATERFVPVDETLDLDLYPVEEPPQPPPVPAKRRGRAKPKPAVALEQPAASARQLEPVVSWSRERETRYRFDGGFLFAEVLVFELPSATFRGGLRFSAQSAVEVRGRGDAVEADFTKQVDAALRKALRGWSTGFAGSNSEGSP